MNFNVAPLLFKCVIYKTIFPIYRDYANVFMRFASCVPARFNSCRVCIALHWCNDIKWRPFPQLVNVRHAPCTLHMARVLNSRAPIAVNSRILRFYVREYNINMHSYIYIPKWRTPRIKRWNNTCLDCDNDMYRHFISYLVYNILKWDTFSKYYCGSNFLAELQ